MQSFSVLKKPSAMQEAKGRTYEYKPRVNKKELKRTTNCDTLATTMRSSNVRWFSRMATVEDHKTVEHFLIV